MDHPHVRESASSPDDYFGAAEDRSEEKVPELIQLSASQPATSSTVSASSSTPERVIWTTARNSDGKVYFCKYAFCETAWTLPVGASVFPPPLAPLPVQREVSGGSSSSDSVQIIQVKKPVQSRPSPTSSLSPDSKAPSSGSKRSSGVSERLNSKPGPGSILSGSGSSPSTSSGSKRSSGVSERLNGQSGFGNTSLASGSSQSTSSGSGGSVRRKCNIPWKSKRMGPSETANIDIYGYRPADYVERMVWNGGSGSQVSCSQVVELHGSDSESDPENKGSGFSSPPSSQMGKKRPLQTNTCKVCQRYWRNEDERKPGQLLSKYVLPCKIHGHKRRPPNTPENYWKMQLTPPKNPYKAPVYEYEKRREQKPP